MQRAWNKPSQTQFQTVNAILFSHECHAQNFEISCSFASSHFLHNNTSTITWNPHFIRITANRSIVEQGPREIDQRTSARAVVERFSGVVQLFPIATHWLLHLLLSCSSLILHATRTRWWWRAS